MVLQTFHALKSLGSDCRRTQGWATLNGGKPSSDVVAYLTPVGIAVVTHDKVEMAERPFEQAALEEMPGLWLQLRSQQCVCDWLQADPERLDRAYRRGLRQRGVEKRWRACI